MARRNRHAEDEGLNLDSLMDALTNVVAVLILVLVLVQADVTKTVIDFLDNLKPATPEEVVQNQKMLAETEVDHKKLLKMLEDDAPSPEEIKKLKADLVIMENDAKTREDLLVEIKQLKQLEKQARKATEAEQKKTESMQKRIAALEAQLDQTPMPKPSPATVVTIPNSRPIPSSAKVYYAMVRNDRVHFIDPFTPAEEYTKICKQNRRDWVLRRIKKRGADTYIYDQRKIVAYFKANPLKNSRGQKLLVPGNPYGTSLHMDVLPDFAKGGTTIEQLRQKRSLFGDIMRKLSTNRRAVVMFKVHPSGFLTYLEARKLAERHRVSAGWEVSGWDRSRIYLREIKVKQLKERPESKKPKVPKPPKIDSKLD